MSAANGTQARAALTLGIPDDVMELIAARAAEIVLERRSVDDADGWLRGAGAIADYLGAPRSRVYALAACRPPRIPVERDGSSLLAKRSTLDAWIRDGGGVRA